MKSFARSPFSATVLIFFLSFTLFVGILAMGFAYAPLSRSVWITLFVLQTLNIFVMFTPLHEAVHFIASKNRFLNELVIWGTWPMFINYTFLFRKIHLSHHAKVNHEEDDPDHFTSHPLLWVRWMKSFFLIFYYYVYAVRNYGRNSSEWTMMIVSVISLAALFACSLIGPYSSTIGLLWFLPSLSATGLLAFANTAWPHHPGKEAGRIQNTRILLVPAPLKWLMFNQNYHLVHHLKPNLPWYEYPRYWAEHGDRLQAQGAVVTDLQLHLPGPFRKTHSSV